MTAKAPSAADPLAAFIEMAGRDLGFLCDEHGFLPLTAETDRRLRSATVTFVKDEVAIEAIYDQRDGVVELKIARLVDGRPFEGYHVDRQGRRCRAHLTEILQRRGLGDFGLKPPRKPETGEQLTGRLLGRYAELLRQHGAEILTGSARALDELATAGKPNGENVTR